MDPIILATAAMAILKPLVKKGAEAAAGEIGKDGVNAGKRLLDALRARWQGDPIAEAKLEALSAEEPTSADEDALAADLNGDQVLAGQVDNIIKTELPKLYVELTAADAGTMTGAEIGTMLRGELTVKMRAGKVGKMYGAKFNQVG